MSTPQQEKAQALREMIYGILVTYGPASVKEIHDRVMATDTTVRTHLDALIKAERVKKETSGSVYTYAVVSGDGDDDADDWCRVKYRHVLELQRAVLTGVFGDIERAAALLCKEAQGGLPRCAECGAALMQELGPHHNVDCSMYVPF